MLQIEGFLDRSSFVGAEQAGGWQNWSEQSSKVITVEECEAVFPCVVGEKYLRRLERMLLLELGEEVGGACEGVAAGLHHAVKVQQEVAFRE